MLITDLHIAINRIDLKHPSYPDVDGNYDWIIAFGVVPTITENVRYMIYIDNDHILGSGATLDPLGQPITVENMYLPEFVHPRGVPGSRHSDRIRGELRRGIIALPPGNQ